MSIISLPFPISNCASAFSPPRSFCSDVRERDVADLDVLVAPLVEELCAADLSGDILWQDWVGLDGLDFDLAVRHVCGSTSPGPGMRDKCRSAAVVLLLWPAG